MPELPDLEVIKDVLRGSILQRVVQAVEAPDPMVLRCPLGQLSAELSGRAILEIRRRGKFLIFDLPGDRHLVINPMLAGRFQYCPAGEKPKTRLCLRLSLEGGYDLRYLDRKRMGRIYWVRGADFSLVPQFAGLGPEANDPSMDLEEFRRMIRRHPGMIKNILTNQQFLAGIGNAYADEILFQAKILPFRRRSSLTAEEVAHLHRAIGEVLSWAIEEIRRQAGDRIHEENRDFLNVHGRGGQACPLCGGTISEVSPNRRRTNFCRSCQR